MRAIAIEARKRLIEEKKSRTTAYLLRQCCNSKSEAERKRELVLRSTTKQFLLRVTSFAIVPDLEAVVVV